MTEGILDHLVRGAALSARRRRLAARILRKTAPYLPRYPPPNQPVFVLGSPRSGTSVVFELLRKSPGLASLPTEGHLLADVFHPGTPAAGHELGPMDVRPHERRALYWLIHHVAHRRRYLDKTPRNSLRVPYLRALFPGAWFVFVIRDGRAAVSSLITAWRSGSPLFPGVPMTGPVAIDGYDQTTWKFVVPRGWEEYARGRTLAEVCAFQWRACAEALIEARGETETKRWVEVRYEDLVAHPEQEVGRLLGELGLPPAPEVLARARRLDQHVTKPVTDPKPDKWRMENPSEVERILPMIQPAMERLGYPLDLSTSAAGTE